jgi:hypothetical protein
MIPFDLFAGESSCIISPFKTDPPLVVNANTKLPCPPANQFFQMIGRRNPQIIQCKRIVKHAQFAQSHRMDAIRKFTRKLPVKDTFRFFIPERLDHNWII